MEIILIRKLTTVTSSELLAEGRQDTATSMGLTLAEPDVRVLKSFVIWNKALT